MTRHTQRYHVLACDFDGTLACHGQVMTEVIESLKQLKLSGRQAILVTGRQLDDLLAILPCADLFERIVAENGALLYNPHDRKERLLVPPIGPEFVARLREHNVNDVSCGRVIVATWTPHENAVLKCIHELGLELQVTFNKGAVMILPSGVNKATGLAAALHELGLSPHNAVAIGDAENDHAMFSLCECAVAVSNALPSVQEHADFTTGGDHGQGVSELIKTLIADDLAWLAPRLSRHDPIIGRVPGGSLVTVSGAGERILIAGSSGSGKSMLALGMLESIQHEGYQFCLIDPEKDFANFEGAIVLGSSQRPPAIEEVVRALSDPAINVVVTLLGLPHDERPKFFARLIARLQELKAFTGRPHWLAVDEAHYLVPQVGLGSVEPLLEYFSGLMLITVHLDHLPPSALFFLDTAIAVGEDPARTLGRLAELTDSRVPDFKIGSTSLHEHVIWRRKGQLPPTTFKAIEARQEHHRHLRKYASGDLGAYHSFYFTGPSGHLKLRAPNLLLFIDLMSGIDDQTWNYHVRRHDVSSWFRGSIRDEDMARQAREIEDNSELTVQDSRARIRELIVERYSPSV